MFEERGVEMLGRAMRGKRRGMVVRGGEDLEEKRGEEDNI